MYVCVTVLSVLNRGRGFRLSLQRAMLVTLAPDKCPFPLPSNRRSSEKSEIAAKKGLSLSLPLSKYCLRFLALSLSNALIVPSVSLPSVATFRRVELCARSLLTI